VETGVCFVKVSFADSKGILFISSAGIVCAFLNSVLHSIVVISVRMSANGMPEILQLHECSFLMPLSFCGMLCDAEEFSCLQCYEVLLWEMFPRFFF
jgi:hypothetical protein